jgi:hypothetical protein
VAPTKYSIDADSLNALLLSTFEQSAAAAFRSYVWRHPFVTKWMIACDFVINEKQAVHDAYAYTFFPYVYNLPTYIAKLSVTASSDFKKTGSISSALKN